MVSTGLVLWLLAILNVGIAIFFLQHARMHSGWVRGYLIVTAIANFVAAIVCIMYAFTS